MEMTRPEKTDFGHPVVVGRTPVEKIAHVGVLLAVFLVAGGDRLMR